MDFNNTAPSVVNEMFLQKTEIAEEKTAMQTQGAAFIRDRIRENSFQEKILPSVGKSPGDPDVQVMMHSDTFYVVVHVEPGATAMSLSFRGEPTAEFIRGTRMPVTFYTISTPKWEGYVDEIRTYPYPITNVIRDNSAKELWTIQDRVWLTHCTSAVIRRHVVANGGATALTGAALIAGTVTEDSIVKSDLAREIADAASAVIQPLLKSDITRLVKRSTAAGRALRTTKILMTEHTFSDYSNLTSADLGDNLAAQVMVDGYKKDQVIGYKIVTSLKGNILNDGFVYGFADPEYLGRSYVLDNVKFWVKRDVRKISFQAWKNVAAALVNIAAVNRLELFGRDATISGGAGYVATYPTAEENLGGVNNTVIDGYAYPFPNVY